MVVIRYYTTRQGASGRAYIGELIWVDGDLLTFEGSLSAYGGLFRKKTYRRDMFDGFPFYGQYLIPLCDYEKI